MVLVLVLVLVASAFSWALDCFVSEATVVSSVAVALHKVQARLIALESLAGALDLGRVLVFLARPLVTIIASVRSMGVRRTRLRAFGR